MPFPTISLEEVERYLDEGRDMALVDLRNRSSYQACHLKGAINVPFQELEAGRACLPTGRLLVLYCSRGGQSLMACRHLSQKGYQVANVANGIAYYRGKYLVSR